MAGNGSLFQRKKDYKWYLIVSKGYDPNYKHGKGGYPQEWIDLETIDEREAKRKQKIIAADIAAGRFHAPAKITLNELIERWIAHGWKRELKRRTIEEYKKLVKTHIKDGLGKELIKDIKPKHIRDLIESKESQYTRKKLYIVLNSSFKLGLADDDLDIAENPCGRVIAPTIKGIKHPTWTADEAKKFLSQVRFSREYGIFLCCLTTGMRIGEVLGLRWIDIDFTKKTISINQTLEEKEKGNPEPKFGTPKTESSKAPLLMTDLLCKELQRIETRQKEERVKVGPFYKNYGLVFTAFDGRPVHLENLRSKYFNGAIEKAGVTKIRIHDMRHSAATLLLNAGISLDIIQRYLRHAQRDTTEIYAHNNDPELLREATEKMDKVLS